MSLSTEVATHSAERRVRAGRRPRLLWLDASRTVALGAMIVFHFARDLEIFGALPPGTTLTGGWAVFAHTVAGTFLFLSGISLVVAHETRFRFGACIRRLLIVSGAAALVTIVTYLVLPDRFVYFGILSEHDLSIRYVSIARRLTWPGRHSLAIYLVHQPLLLALLWVTTVLVRQ